MGRRIVSVAVLVFVLAWGCGEEPAGVEVTTRGQSEIVPVTLTILNKPSSTGKIEVARGDAVEVAFQFNDSGAIPLPARASIRLASIASGVVIDEILVGGMSAGKVSLDTAGAAAGECQVSYVAGTLVVGASQTVWVTVKNQKPIRNIKVSRAQDLQDAVTRIADSGGMIHLASGVYNLTQPIQVSGKDKLRIIGAGTSRTGKGPVTRIVAPAPRPVLDAQGRVVLPAKDVRGTLSFSGGDVRLQNLDLVGGDAALLFEDDAVGNPSSAELNNITISDAGRGVLVRSSGGKFKLHLVVIEDATYNGISVAPANDRSPHLPIMFSSNQTKVAKPLGVGIYLVNVNAVVTNAGIYGAAFGGIVVKDSWVSIYNAQIHYCSKVGIILYSSIGHLEDNTIHFTQAIQKVDSGGVVHAVHGDGISAVLSPVNAYGSKIYASARAGISTFGGQVQLKDNKLFCNMIHLNYEAWQGLPGSFHELGGTTCRCNPPYKTCKSLSSGVQPPTPPEYEE